MTFSKLACEDAALFALPKGRLGALGIENYHLGLVRAEPRSNFPCAERGGAGGGDAGRAAGAAGAGPQGAGPACQANGAARRGAARPPGGVALEPSGA